MGSSGTPVISACGTAPTLGTGSTDSYGTINVGSGVVLSCTLTFSITAASPPHCVVGTNLSTVVPGWSTSTTTLTTSLSLTLGGGKIYYICMGV